MGEIIHISNNGNSGSGIPEAPNDGSQYVRNGNSAVWQKLYGQQENFPLHAMNGSENMNGGTFWGSIQKFPQGSYNKLSFPFTQLSLSGSDSRNIRCAMYDENGDLIVQGVFAINSSTIIHVNEVITYTEQKFIVPRWAYGILGNNDQVGGGSVQVPRADASGLNQSDKSFSFNQPTGPLPATLPSVSNENKAFYQNWWGS